jgi:diguanylate cyclase (GGDEF)-like protein
VTLRARLTVAFLAVVLGPVLLGAVFVGGTTAAVNRSRSLSRLDLASTALHGIVDGLCQRLDAAARTAALTSAGGRDPRAAQQVVELGLADVLWLVDGAGNTLSSAPQAPPGTWADCAGTGTGGAVRYAAIAARIAMRDGSGHAVGFAYAAFRIDAGLLDRLASAAGAAVTLLGGDAPLSTETAGQARRIAATAALQSGGATSRIGDGRYVHRLAVTPGQPLPLAVSVTDRAQTGLYLLLALVVLTAGLVSLVATCMLARGTTRPLAELAAAAARVADGDLGTRVPVRRRDEVGQLGITFNRMTREMQAYVDALTASRDQLRGHLGLLGDTLSSTHDLERILQVILRTAVAATGAQAGVVMLADPGGGVLVGQCGHGLAERGGAGPLRLPLGAGLLGRVAQTGEPARGRLDRDAPELAPGEPCGNTYIVVPFSTRRAPGSDPAESAVRGVLALYDRLGGEEFDDDDQATLRKFAAQSAVAAENVRVHEEAKRLSYTDPLTGLYNYRMLRESLRREVERANRYGHQLCLLVLDLDRFKDVNDTYGHAAGDAVLAEFARRLRSEIREVDLAFRQGGEEFVLLLPETDVLGGVTLAERLGTATREVSMSVPARPALPARGAGPARPPVPGRPAMPEPGRAGRPAMPEPGRAGRPAMPEPGRAGRRGEAPGPTLRIPVTVSIGIAVFPDHGSTGTAVLAAADDALYVAKGGGRDTYRVADPPPLVPATPGLPAPPLAGARPSGGTPTGGIAPVDLGGSAGPHAPRQSRGR